MKKMNINVNYQKLFLPNKQYVVELSKNYLEVQFNFLDDNWNNCDLIIAILKNTNGEITKEVLDNNNSIIVKKQVLIGGYFEVSLCGYNHSQNQEIPTDVLTVPVNNSLKANESDVEETTYDKIDKSLVKARLDEFSRLVFTRNNGEEIIVLINDTTYFKGEFTSYEELVKKYPTGETGEYAYVNTTDNEGDLLIKYAWDADSNSWKEYSTDKYVTSAQFQLFKTYVENKFKNIKSDSISIEDGIAKIYIKKTIDESDLETVPVFEPIFSVYSSVINGYFDQRLLTEKDKEEIMTDMELGDAQHLIMGDKGETQFIPFEVGNEIQQGFTFTLNNVSVLSKESHSYRFKGTGNLDFAIVYRGNNQFFIEGMDEENRYFSNVSDTIVISGNSELISITENENGSLLGETTGKLSQIYAQEFYNDYQQHVKNSNDKFLEIENDIEELSDYTKVAEVQKTLIEVGTVIPTGTKLTKENVSTLTSNSAVYSYKVVGKTNYTGSFAWIKSQQKFSYYAPSYMGSGSQQQYLDEIVFEEDVEISYIPLMSGPQTIYLITETRFTSQEIYDNFNENITNLNENKVDKVEGKGLSTNDYTDEDKTFMQLIQESSAYVGYGVSDKMTLEGGTNQEEIEQALQEDY